MADDVINEKDSYFVIASFFDQDGLAVTPDDVSYRIDDVDSGTEIKGDTTITLSGPSAEIEIVPDENRIVDPSRLSERRRVTMTMTFGGTRKKSGEHYYQVRNLAKVS